MGTDTIFRSEKRNQSPFSPALQRLGLRDPTRAANNPGRCDAIDETLHDWAAGALPETFGFGECKIDTIVAGHTHRPVYENLSLTERMHLGLKRAKQGREEQPNSGGLGLAF